MIWQLMRRDQACRTLRWFAPACAAACLLWHFVPDLWDLLALLAVYPFFSLPPAYAMSFQHRDVYFQAVLPIAPRQIYLSRVFPMLVLLWLPVATGAVFGHVSGHPGFTVTLLDFGSLYLLVVMATQSIAIQCKLLKPGVNAFNLFWLCGWRVCAISGLPGWLLRQGALATVAFPLICWLAIAAIVRGTCRVLPASFDFAPHALLPPDVREEAGRSGRLPFARLRLIFVNILSPHPFWFLVFVIVGMLPASRWPYQTAVMLWIFLGTVWGETRSKTRWLVALPVSPRKRLAAILVPALLAVIIGYEIGLRVPEIADTMERGVVVTSSADTEIADISKDCKMFNVIPPAEYLIRAPKDDAPAIRAPWGETNDPATNSVDGFDVYNPYTTGCSNSERFLDWQFARATAAVYGHSIPRNRAEGSYVVTSQLAIPQLRRQLVMLALTACCLMLAMWIVILEDWYRWRHLPWALRRLICILAGLLLMVLFVLFADISQGLSWALPSNPFAAIAVALIPLALIYWPLDVLFRRLEFDQKPVRSRA